MRFELEWMGNSESAALIISANGKSRYFKKIDDFVAKAPVIPNWEIYALEHPPPIDFSIEEEFGDTGIDPHQLWFMPMYEGMDGELFDVIIYSSMYRKEYNDSFDRAVEVVLWNLLGERSFALDIGEVIVDNLSCASEGVELIKLEDLPAYLAGRKSPFVVDASGEIREMGY